MENKVPKIALISPGKSSDWVSCQSIASNLRQSYAHLENVDICHFVSNNNDSRYQNKKVATALHDWGADLIAYIDHQPCATELLHALRVYYKDYRPRVLLHVFGDFLLYASQLFQYQDSLLQFPMDLICASDKQAKLISTMVMPEQSKIHAVPFPVKKETFHFSEDLRKHFRQGWKAADSEILFLYSGRLSLQKNVLQVIRAFELFQREIQPHSRLFLAGPIDDLGIPYLGKSTDSGLMAYDLRRLIQTVFDPSRQDKVQYIGNLTPTDLNQVYNGCDIFFSLSAHNDEDYGMAPAEALMTGSHCILSDWGGYSSFYKFMPNACQLVPVRMARRTVGSDLDEVVKRLMTTPAAFDLQERKKKAESAVKIFSIQEISQKIDAIIRADHRMTFQGFGPLFGSLVQNQRVNPKAPLAVGDEYSKLYKEIYSVYCN